MPNVPNVPVKAWNSPPVVGQAETPRALGGVVTPVLAGFALAAVALLVTTDNAHLPPLHDEAVLAFVVAVAVLLAAMQFSAASVRYASRPAERMDLAPEAKLEIDVLNLVRAAQHKDRYLEDAYSNRARVFYNLGLIAFLLGLGLMVWPSTINPSEWARLIGAGVIGIATLGEVLWALQPRMRTQSLFPDYDSVPDGAAGGDLAAADPVWTALKQP